MKTFVLVLTMLFFLWGCGIVPGIAPQPEVVAFQAQTEQGFQGGLATQIPEALIQFFNGVVVALFTAGFVWVFEKIRLDFRQYAIPLAGTFATWVVAEFQGYLNTVPDIQDPYWNLLFRILLALIPAAGVLRLVSKQPGTLIEYKSKV